MAGIDLSEVAVAQAAAGHDEAAFLRADVRRLPFADQCFDAVIGDTFAGWQSEYLERAAVPSDTRMLDVLLARLTTANAVPSPALGNHPRRFDEAGRDRAERALEAEEDRLAAASLAAGDPTGWFDRLYAAGARGKVPVPWNRRQPHPLLVEWARHRGLSGAGRRAIVVGCGLGADAEYVAGLGYDTVAFDIADTAIRLACERYPHSPVHYAVVDLLDPPRQWLRAFDLVVEIITVQALPDPPRCQAIANVARLAGPGGTLIVIAAVHSDTASQEPGPPWPLKRAEKATWTSCSGVHGEDAAPGIRGKGRPCLA